MAVGVATTMATADKGDWLTEGFEATGGTWRAVAYRMLGSTGEADEPVQEAWLAFPVRTSAVCRTRRLVDHGRQPDLPGHAPCADGTARSAARRACSDLIERLADGPDSRAGGVDGRLGRSALLVVLDTLAPAGASPSCSTTCSRCPSTRSPRSSSALRARRRCSPAARQRLKAADATRGNDDPAPPPCRRCAHSSPPLAAVTSTPCCRAAPGRSCSRADRHRRRARRAARSSGAQRRGRPGLGAERLGRPGF